MKPKTVLMAQAPFLMMASVAAFRKEIKTNQIPEFHGHGPLEKSWTFAEQGGLIFESLKSVDGSLKWVLKLVIGTHPLIGSQARSGHLIGRGCQDVRINVETRLSYTISSQVYVFQRFCNDIGVLSEHSRGTVSFTRYITVWRYTNCTSS